MDSSPNINSRDQIEKDALVGHVACLGEKRHAYRFWVRKSEGRKRIGRPRPRYGDNIKVYIKEIRWEGLEWIGSGPM